MEEKGHNSKIEFQHVEISDKADFERLLSESGERGCEFTFANFFMWGRQTLARIHGHIAMFSQFNRRSVYPFPLGRGDKKSVIDAIISDAAERGIPCRITGLIPEAREQLEALYPGKFRYHSDEGSFDYVYSIDDLADLPGKKYHSKRNHIARFLDAHPSYKVIPITEENIQAAADFSELWIKEKLEADPDADYHMERAALARAFKSFSALELCGLILMDGDEVLGFTVASRQYENTMDVHFEKARGGVQGAYAVINCEMAKYIREKYPEIKYLNREEDLGLEGLRKSKKSYYPHHQINKCWACLLEDGYDY